MEAKDFLEWLLGLISGCLLGLSSGLGFWTKYEQPKNIKIQGVLGVIGLTFLALLFWYIYG